MERNYWFVTRPKRKLILVPELIKIFGATAEGKSWYGNRELQLQFEKSLTKSGWKAQNISRDASGGRTYAVLLYMFGLWYEDNSAVHITNAGREIIDGRPPVPILTKQLLDFQYPSPYSIKPNVNISREIRVQPYRFILRLLLETEIREISQEEVAFCLVPFAKTGNDIKKCADLINEYRLNTRGVVQKALEITYKSEQYLKDIGNTIVNQLEYTGFFVENENIKSLKFAPNKKQKAKNFLSEIRRGLIQNPENESTFQRRYGSGIEKTKDYTGSLRKPMEITPNQRKVLEEFFVLVAQKPVFSVDQEVIENISRRLGAPKNLVEETLRELPLNISGKEFEDTYLRLATGGRSTARDFERKTKSLIQEGFNLDAKWVGNLKRHPDVLVFINDSKHEMGLVDTKAYSDYSLPLDHKNKMAINYIRDFESYEYKGMEYELSFFMYIAGGFSSNIQNSFDELLEMTKYPGSYITARNMLFLYHFHQENKLTASELNEIFSCQKEIIPHEIN